MLEIRLIGRPRLLRDGEPTDPPRGNKTWAVLARLVRSPDPVGRQQLAGELFADADDPLGALRWSLAELRRRTGLTAAFSGNPLSFDVDDAVVVDTEAVRAGSLGHVPPQGDFLEGVRLESSPGFEAWLLVERQRVDGEIVAALRRAAMEALAGREFERGIELASAMVQRAPLDEGSHVLLVKTMVAAGDLEGAAEQASHSERRLRDGLGAEPSDALRAATRPSVAARLPGVSPGAAAASKLEAGMAALSAGAADAGVDCLRGACSIADSTGDVELRSRCTLELGTALVHAIRGYDDEGAVLLQQAVTLANDAGAAELAAKAFAELGYVDTLAGRRHSARQYLSDAAALVEPGTAVEASIAGVAAMNLHDWGRVDAAAAEFERALELSRRASSRRWETWVLGLGARTMFALGDLRRALEWAGASCDLVETERWIAFRPLPAGWRAEFELVDGRPAEEVRRDGEALFALAR